MKKFTLLAIAAVLTIACKTNSNSSSTGENGKLVLSLNPKSDIEVVETRSSSVNINDFQIDIIDNDGVSYASYASYSDVPAEIALPLGLYTVKATTGRLNAAEWDSPHFAGSKAIVVESGKTTNTSLTCAITNVKVTVNYTTELVKTLRDVRVTVSSKYDASDATKIGRLSYYDGEERGGWFAKPVNKTLDIYITGTNISTGDLVSTTTSISNVEARQWRNITVDTKTSGTVGIEIVIDDTLEKQDDVDVDILDNNDIIDNNGDTGNWDEPENPDPNPNPNPDPDPDPVDDKPTITGNALGTEGSSTEFNIDQVIRFKITQGYNILDVALKSKDDQGISNLYLLMESEALQPLLESMLGITGEIDLANPDTNSDWYDVFTQIGLLDPAVPVKGQKEYMFSVGGLMEMLWAVIENTSNQGDTHLFHLKVVDAKGQTEKTLSIILE